MDSIATRPDPPVACITLDLENDWYFDREGYDHLTFDYIDRYVELISSLDVPVSVFVVGETLERYPDDVECIHSRIDSEFHLHSYTHDLSKSYDFREEVGNGVVAFESHFGRRPIGYRAPQGNVERSELCQLDSMGFEFDSSVFPTFRPGIYNNLDAPIVPYRPAETERLVEYPIGVLPWVRIPLSQSYLKLFGRLYLRALERLPLPNVVVFDSHLQDFYRTASHDQLDVPLRLIHMRNLDNSIDLFRSFVRILRQKGYTFVKLTDVHERVISR